MSHLHFHFVDEGETSRHWPVVTWSLIVVNVAVYLATPRDLDWHLATSAERVFYPSVPLALVGLALLLGAPPATGDATPRAGAG